MVIIKSEYDIQCIKEAAAIWKKVRAAMYENTKAGVSLKYLDNLANEVIQANGATAAFHNYLNFPGHICISVNECVIHGVPTEYILKDGDMVTFDVGVKYKDHYCDAAYTIIINENVEAQKISDVCYQALNQAISIIKPKTTTHKISQTIQKYVESNGYYVIRDFAGHGCGNEIHEDPLIPNYKSILNFPNESLKENMVICIEPMILTKSNAYYIDPLDNWSVKSKNHLLTCHWEHMILVTKDGCEVLTA